ncbi:hypothetical protein F5X99DRAFT_135813 [Biscogniauxia marginata]|nr:hypothetical protein F5X99DRAFT_135813 [Biscogniauxia marginata]
MIARPRRRGMPIAAAGISAKEGMLGLGVAEWKTRRYAWALDNKLRSMKPGSSLQFLRSEHASLMARYQNVRDRRKRHDEFEEDLVAVEKVILYRSKVLMARILELEKYEDGLKPIAKVSVFRSMWNRIRIATKGKSLWNLFS